MARDPFETSVRKREALWRHWRNTCQHGYKGEFTTAVKVRADRGAKCTVAARTRFHVVDCDLRLNGRAVPVIRIFLGSSGRCADGGVVSATWVPHSLLLHTRST